MLLYIFNVRTGCNFMLWCQRVLPVSYTHLDVYKRQVNTAAEFDKRLDFDGVILTKLDGDSRGGAALSIRSCLLYTSRCV